MTNLLQDATLFIWTLSYGVCTDCSRDSIWFVAGLQPNFDDDTWLVTADGIPQMITEVKNDDLTNWDSTFFNPGTTPKGEVSVSW